MNHCLASKSPDDHQHHPLTEWIKSGHKLRQNNQSKLSQSINQPNSLPCYPASHATPVTHSTLSSSSPLPPSQSKCMNRKRIDQMSDREIQHLIHLSLLKKQLIKYEQHLDQSNIHSNLKSTEKYSLPGEANICTKQQVIIDESKLSSLNSPEACSPSFNDKSIQSNKSHYSNVTRTQPKQQRLTDDTSFLSKKFPRTDSTDQRHVHSIDSDPIWRRDSLASDCQSHSFDYSCIDNCYSGNSLPVTSSSNGDPINSSNISQSCLADRTNSPSLEQLIEQHRNTGVTVRPKVWPRVRKEPLFAPLWETQSTRDSPISDSLIMVKSPAPSSLQNVINGNSVAVASSSPLPAVASTAVVDSATAAPDDSSSKMTAASVSQAVIYETNYSNSDSNDTCVSGSNDLADTGICVTSPTTTNSSSISPSLEIFSTSNSSSTDEKIYPRHSFIDDFKLPPKPPSTTYSNGFTSSNINEESVRERIHRKSFYRRFNDDTAHNSPRFKSASPARRRSSLLDGDDLLQMNINDRSTGRRSFSHASSPSPTPGSSTSSARRSSLYNQSISSVDRKDSVNTADRFTKMETRANQMLSEMRNQITDVRDSTVSKSDARRRPSSLSRNAGTTVTPRPATTYYSNIDDSDSDDDDDEYMTIASTSRPVNYTGRATAASGSTASDPLQANYKSNENFFSSPPMFSSLFFAN